MHSMHSSNQNTINNTKSKNNQTSEINGVEASNMQENLKNLTLNSNAKVYVPRKNKATNDEANNNNKQTENKEEKLNLNLNAEEYKPKTQTQTSNYENPYQIKQLDESDENEELENEELDMIVNDLVENDAYEEFEEEDESDDEKWFPKYKDCECCKGLIYKCKGSACVNMGVCYCKMKEECDDEY